MRALVDYLVERGWRFGGWKEVDLYLFYICSLYVRVEEDEMRMRMRMRMR
jgi:hypothetical protein